MTLLLTAATPAMPAATTLPEGLNKDFSAAVMARALQRARQSPGQIHFHPPARFPMPSRRLNTLLAALSVTALAACSSMGSGGSQRTSAGYGVGPAEVDTAVVVLPTTGAGEQMRAGCWASFYAERNFNGDSLTLIGPVELQTLDRGSARQLKRDIKSVVTGPRATLVVYQKQMLSARSVGFQPNSREPGLVEMLGFGGQIESMQLSCN